MTVADLTDVKLIQNLKDAGCSNHIIENFMNLYHAQSAVQQKKVLADHRRALLDKIHKSQKMLDCLDYLIYRLNQRWANNTNSFAPAAKES